MSSPYTGAYTPEDPLVGQQTPEERRSIGDILGDVSRDVSTLMRQEVELAKAELKQSSSKAGKGAGLLAGAGVAGLLFLVFLTVSAWWGLGQFVGNQWSALIVAVIWAIVAAVLALQGKKELDKIRGLPTTAETVSKIPDALKGHEENNR
jgi:hypothetical protein